MESKKDSGKLIDSRAAVFVVIPTKNRRQTLLTALRSVALQSFKPTAILVVGDSEKDVEGLEQAFTDLPNQGNPTPFITMVDRRTSNLSGSLNTAISHILNDMVAPPESSYIAFLDDDDAWEPKYLEECLTTAVLEDLDWVIAGIIRHEAKVGIDLSIPVGLTIRDFLSTNPHVQGSNLFVRLSTILRAGGFDENLQSTTDRDLAIRLLSLGNTRIGFVREHLVHHLATEVNRLSTPGSESKKSGLVAFYQKHGPTMSAQDRARFVERACNLFGCAIQDFAGVFGG